MIIMGYLDQNFLPTKMGSFGHVYRFKYIHKIFSTQTILHVSSVQDIFSSKEQNSILFQDDHLSTVHHSLGEVFSSVHLSGSIQRPMHCPIL